MQSFDYKKLLPHAAIIGLFLVVSLFYSYPALKGQILMASDNVSWKASSQEAREWHEKTGENTLWSNSMFGGMPTYTFYIPESNNFIGHIHNFFTEVLPKPSYFFFLAMLGFYILMCTLRVNRWLGAIGAFAYTFATYNIEIIATGHETKMLALAYMPMVLSGVLMTYRGDYLVGGVLLGISFALFNSTGHLQISYYFALVMVIAVIAFFIQAFKDGQLKRFFIASAVCLAAFGAGFATGMAGMLPLQEYTKTTMRGGESELTFNHDTEKAKSGGGLDKDYAFQWSNGIGETFCILIPDLYGGSGSEPLEKAPKAGEILSSAGYNAVPLYWGPQPFLAGPVYFGAIICFLFVLGLLVIRSYHKWWILAACILGFMMSWGRHFPAFNYFIFDNLPFYNKFRAPSTALIIPQFLFPLLGIWALKDIISKKVSQEELVKQLKIALGITAGLCLLLGVGGSMFFDFTNPTEAKYPQQLIEALKEDRADLAMQSGLRSAVFILLAGGLIWAFVKEKINTSILTAGLGLLIVIDLLPVANNYLNEDNYQDESDYEALFQPRPVDQQILQDKDPYYRVLDLSRNVYNDAMQSYFHKAIGGYSPAKMEVYQDLIDVHMSKSFNTEVLNMLNTKYIIYNAGENNPVAQVNNTANGNAWFVDSIHWAKTADEEILSMKAAGLGDTTVVADPWNSKSVAIVRESHRSEINNYAFGKDSAASINLTKYGLNDLEYQSNNSKDGLAVFSDIYYDKGWEAYVDGKQVNIIRVDYLLRAIKIPAGNHKIEFHFRPKSFATGNTITLISNILLLGMGAFVLVQLFRGRKPNLPAE
jgi:hypothetical protein